MSNPADAHSLDDPEKKPILDLERRKVTAFTHRIADIELAGAFSGTNS